MINEMINESLLEKLRDSKAANAKEKAIKNDFTTMVRMGDIYFITQYLDFVKNFPELHSFTPEEVKAFLFVNEISEEGGD